MKNKIKYLPLGILTLTTVVSGVALAMPGALAATGSADATVTVLGACGFTTTGFTSTFSGNAGTTYDTTSETREATVTCNDPDGFTVNMQGKNGTTYSTDLTGTVATNKIATGTATTGATSNWAFKITSVTGGTVADTDEDGTPDFTVGTYYAVPGTSTPIAKYPGATSSTAVTGKFRTDYRIYVSSTQAADTYTGGVEYTVVTL